MLMILEKKTNMQIYYHIDVKKVFKMQSKGMMNTEFRSVYVGGDMGLEEERGIGLRDLWPLLGIKMGIKLLVVLLLLTERREKETLNGPMKGVLYIKD